MTTAGAPATASAAPPDSPAHDSRVPEGFFGESIVPAEDGADVQYSQTATATITLEIHMEPGTQLGPYAIVDRLGAGGMGEVYLADDTRLGRKVAVKVLPVEFAVDSERLARFEQEARAAAALNHPGIAAIYDVGVEGEGSERTHYMVQEFLEGQTLQEFIARGAVPQKKALTLGAEIARALAVAHQAGIIHRDLKPANIFVTPSGNAKILDFGLAKLTEMSAVSASGEGSMSPTVVGTMAGTIMGTAGYMAPEQVHGENVDQRADLFALGCVLYEMLGGQRAFGGKSLPDTLAKILHEEPATISGLARPLERALEKCLAKDPLDRYQHADDLAVDLRYLAAQGLEAHGLSGGSQGTAENAGRARSMKMAVAGAIMSAFAIGVSVEYFFGSPGAGAGAYPGTSLPVQLTQFATAVQSPAISRNGQMVAFVATDPIDGWGQIYVKALPDGPPLRLTNTPDHKESPAFSPDGSRVAFTVIREDWKWDTWSVSITGGEPRLMLRNANALHWTADDRIVFAQYREGAHLGIATADESGANTEDIWFPPMPHQMAHEIDVSPDGGKVAIGYMFATTGDSFTECFVSELPVPEGEPVPIADGPGCRQFIRFSVDGEWLYYESSDDEIWRSPTAGGSAEQIVGSFPGVDDIRGFAVTPDGERLVFAAGSQRYSVWLRRADGTEHQLTFEDDASAPQFSADGEDIVYRQSSRRGSGRLWRYRTRDGAREEICPGLDARDFVQAPDGNRILVLTAAESAESLLLCHVDGAEAPRELLSELPSFSSRPLFGADSETVFIISQENDRFLLQALEIATGTLRTIHDLDGRGDLIAVSPDGEWLSVNRGRATSSAWLYPVDGGEPRFLMDGWELEWSPGGSSFLFLNDGMVSSAWELLNPGGLLVPNDLPEAPDTEWLRNAGAVRLMTAMGFSRLSPSPTPFEGVFSRSERRSNLFSVELPQ